MTERIQSRKIEKGRSMLNATDETANPYGLILSEKEREFIYGSLNSIDFRADAILRGRKGWRQQAEAAFGAVMDLCLAVLLSVVLHSLLGVLSLSAIIAGIAFVVLHKLNLLLTHEKAKDTTARQEREGKKEAKERAEYFKDMGIPDRSLEQ